MQVISLNLNFSGVVLPVVDCEDSKGGKYAD